MHRVIEIQQVVGMLPLPRDDLFGLKPFRGRVGMTRVILFDERPAGNALRQS